MKTQEIFDKSENGLLIKLDFEKRKNAIISEMAENIIFEYDELTDNICFNHSIPVIAKNFIEIKNLSKSNDLIRFFHPLDIQTFLKFLRDDECKSERFRVLTKEGYKWYQGSINKIHNKSLGRSIKIGSIIDIRTQLELENKNISKSSIDRVTGLYTTEYMKKEIDKFISTCESDTSSAMLLIDIADFDKLNQQFGYLYGNKILYKFAETLKEKFKQDVLIGRVGGDKFMIFIKHLEDRNQLYPLSNEVKQYLEQIYTGATEERLLSCYTGVALYPADGKRFDILFQHSDTAIYVAKKKRKGSFVFYENCFLHLYDDEKEFYQNYNIDEKSQKHSKLNNELAALAVDMIANSGDINNTMQVFLTYCSDLIKVDQIRIYEVAENQNELYVSLSSRTNQSIVEKHIVYEEKDLIQFKAQFADGLFFAEDTGKIASIRVKLFLYEQGIHATAQCAFYRKNQFLGCVSIEDLEKTRRFSEQDLSVLYTLTKIVSTYHNKLKEQEEELIRSELNSFGNDPLTNCYVHEKFVREVKEYVDAFPYTQYAIVSSHIFRLNHIIQLYGTETESRVLYEYGKMIRQHEDFFLKVGHESDHSFVALIRVYDALNVCRQLNALHEVYSIKQSEWLKEFKLKVFAGIAFLKNSSMIEECIHKAMSARKCIPDVHQSSCQWYDSNQENKLLTELNIVKRQNTALKNKEFEVYLQPKISLKENQLVGVEALVRWKNEDGSLMNPDEFIPIFEKNGFIIDLDYYVYETVCKMIKQWKGRKQADIPVSVNVSRLHLNDNFFLNRFQSIVDRYGIEPNKIEVELTESMVIANTNQAVITMDELRRHGFTVAIDDFGSGQSSLKLLKDIKTDILKLDKEFLRKGEMKREDKIIISSIIQMAKQLDMKVLSEGVETEIQSEFLKQSACDYAQGYLYAKPMPIAEFERYLLNFQK